MNLIYSIFGKKKEIEWIKDLDADLYEEILFILNLVNVNKTKFLFSERICEEWGKRSKLTVCDLKNIPEWSSAKIVQEESPDTGLPKMVELLMEFRDYMNSIAHLIPKEEVLIARFKKRIEEQEPHLLQAIHLAKVQREKKDTIEISEELESLKRLLDLEINNLARQLEYFDNPAKLLDNPVKIFELFGLIKEEVDILCNLESRELPEELKKPYAYENAWTTAAVQFARFLESPVEHNEKYNFLPIISLLKGQTLIDLGCGGSPMALFLASKWGCKKYIGVDPNYKMNNEFINLMKEKEEKFNKKINLCDYEFIKMDMLSYLTTLPDNSVNFLIGGIDTNITYSWPKEYLENVYDLLSRKTRVPGIIIFNYSVSGNMYKRLNFKRIKLDPEYGTDIEVYIKISKYESVY